MHDHLPSTLVRARKLRKAVSLPEALLWRELKAQPRGLRFRRQHPIGKFVTDFYCHSAKLAVEVDGIVHDMGDQPQYDACRTAILEQHGVRVFRITAGDVLNDLDAATRAILEAASAASLPPSVLRTATSPAGGGFALEQ